jgi:NADH-quinone oxidoreductase subunit G
MLTSPRHAYVLFGIEPNRDLAEGVLAEQALKSADVVVCFTPFASDSVLECADVLLPIGTFAETSGTFVNGEGRWQSFEAAADPVGDSRPGWRVLRVLGNALGVPDFEFQSSEEVRDTFRAQVGDAPPDNSYDGSVEIHLDDHGAASIEVDVPIYSIDALVRRSLPLQKTLQAVADVTDAPDGSVKSA